jgi:DDE family transposase
VWSCYKLLRSAGDDLLNNQGWVSVGIDHDTAEFAVHSNRQWWVRIGRRRFPRGRTLLITADGGRQQRISSRLWKRSLQTLADELGLTLAVCHVPPGTSQWNKIEHRLFSFITQNWRGKPLISLQAIVNLIAATTTRSGLIVKAALDTHHYDTAIQVSERTSLASRTPHRICGTRG